MKYFYNIMSFEMTRSITQMRYDFLRNKYQIQHDNWPLIRMLFDRRFEQDYENGLLRIMSIAEGPFNVIMLIGCGKRTILIFLIS